MPPKPRRKTSKQTASKAIAPADPVEEFLKTFAVEDISFADWQNCHTDLDVIIPVFLAPDAAKSGCRHTLSFTRTCFDRTSDGKTEKSREKLSVDVDIPANAAAGMRIVIERLGDRRDGDYGRLIVEIRLRQR